MYGIDRLDSDKEHIVLFYNMGGLDTEVSVVKYSAIHDIATNKSYESIEILAESYLKDYGGFTLDKVLLNMLVSKFNNMKER